MCNELCIQFEYIYKNCSCLDPSIPIVNNFTVCATISKLECVARLRDLLDIDSDLTIETCSKYCPHECKYFKYNTRLSMADYPTEYYYKVIRNQSNLVDLFNNSKIQINYETFKMSLLYVNVFFEELIYTAIVESPALTFDQVLGE